MLSASLIVHTSLVATSSSLLPTWAEALLGWLFQPLVLALLGGSSVLLFVLSVIGVPMFLTRMPTDFFSRPERRRRRLGEHRRPFWFMILRWLRNALGALLLLLGLVMLFTPGSGLLVATVGLFLVDFPGKRRFQRWLISRPSLHGPVNKMRRRAGRPPLELPVLPGS